MEEPDLRTGLVTQTNYAGNQDVYHLRQVFAGTIAAYVCSLLCVSVRPVHCDRPVYKRRRFPGKFSVERRTLRADL